MYRSLSFLKLFSGLHFLIWSFLKQDTPAWRAHNWGLMTIPTHSCTLLFLSLFGSLHPTCPAPQLLIQCFPGVIHKWLVNKCLTVGITVTKVGERLIGGWTRRSRVSIFLETALWGIGLYAQLPGQTVAQDARLCCGHLGAPKWPSPERIVCTNTYVRYTPRNLLIA